jgi:glycosyltransferase involved in cell wall biosynthesis
MHRSAVVVPAFNEAKSINFTLYALLTQTTSPEAIVVVDNNSTDATSDIVDTYAAQESRVRLLHEPIKGTGVACQTGFRYAIDQVGAEIVSRTDADTVPANRWVDSFLNYFDQHGEKQLVTGPTRPLSSDEYYRQRDRVLYPAIWYVMRLGSVIVNHSRMGFRIAPGHNLAIRSEAYDAVGGFPASSIDVTDEDLVLSRAIFEKYGFRAMGFEPDMFVNSSTRRIREVGYLRLLKYYAQPSKEYRLAQTDGNIDIR